MSSIQIGVPQLSTRLLRASLHGNVARQLQQLVRVRLPWNLMPTPTPRSSAQLVAQLVAGPQTAFGSQRHAIQRASYRRARRFALGAQSAMARAKNLKWRANRWYRIIAHRMLLQRALLARRRARRLVAARGVAARQQTLMRRLRRVNSAPTLGPEGLEVSDASPVAALGACMLLPTCTGATRDRILQAVVTPWAAAPREFSAFHDDAVRTLVPSIAVTATTAAVMPSAEAEAGTEVDGATVRVAALPLSPSVIMPLDLLPAAANEGSGTPPQLLAMSTLGVDVANAAMRAVDAMLPIPHAPSFSSASSAAEAAFEASESALSAELDAVPHCAQLPSLAPSTATGLLASPAGVPSPSCAAARLTSPRSMHQQFV